MVRSFELPLSEYEKEWVLYVERERKRERARERESERERERERRIFSENGACCVSDHVVK
jgi:hypothetical protein